MHVSVEAVERATAEVKRFATIAPFQSATGRRPGWARNVDLRNIAVPTSYTGSEITNVWGMTKDNRKITGRDDTVVPILTIYDHELTLSMPSAFAGAKWVECQDPAAANLASKDINPIDSVMAWEVIRALSHNLPVVVSTPGDTDVRTEFVYGACLAGGALGMGTTGLHDRLCHTLGGTFNAPHAENHTTLLSHRVAYNAGAVPEGTRKIAEAMEGDGTAIGICELAETVGFPTVLKDVGVKTATLSADVGEAAATHAPGVSMSLTGFALC